MTTRSSSGLINFVFTITTMKLDDSSNKHLITLWEQISLWIFQAAGYNSDYFPISDKK